jgi:hypothetical protein
MDLEYWFTGMEPSERIWAFLTWAGLMNCVFGMVFWVIR